MALQSRSLASFLIVVLIQFYADLITAHIQNMEAMRDLCNKFGLDEDAWQAEVEQDREAAIAAVVELLRYQNWLPPKNSNS